MITRTITTAIGTYMTSLLLRLTKSKGKATLAKLERAGGGHGRSTQPLRQRSDEGWVDWSKRAPTPRIGT